MIPVSITLSDGSSFELKDNESVKDGLARAAALEAQGITPSEVTASESYKKAASSSTSLKPMHSVEDGYTAVADAKARVDAGEETDSDTLLLGLVKGDQRGKPADEIRETITSKFVGAALSALVGRVERVNAEIKDLQDDRKEIYAEVKIFGFDVPTVKRVIRLRKMEAEVRAERAALDAIYMEAAAGGAAGEIPLPGLSEKKRKKSQARVKKETARDAHRAEEKAAADALGDMVAGLRKDVTGGKL